jgi:hypothetical protein
MVAKKKTTAVLAEEPVTLGKAVIVYPRGSQHWIALSAPSILEVHGARFIQGIQITGNPGHRFEQKKTLVPMENVGTIVQFEEEEDIWSKPQPKHIAPVGDEPQSTPLTSHERGKPNFDKGLRHNGGRGNRNRHPHNKRRSEGGSDARFQQQYDSVKDKNFNR